MVAVSPNAARPRSSISDGSIRIHLPSPERTRSQQPVLRLRAVGTAVKISLHLQPRPQLAGFECVRARMITWNRRVLFTKPRNYDKSYPINQITGIIVAFHPGSLQSTGGQRERPDPDGRTFKRTLANVGFSFYCLGFFVVHLVFCGGGHSPTT